MSIWQSIRSVIPPCPGMLSPKSFIFKALLNPLAKKPPGSRQQRLSPEQIRRGLVPGLRKLCFGALISRTKGAYDRSKDCHSRGMQLDGLR